jgi:diadenosine tetraphosphate (Ap4A) HIT family hydrolase
LVTSKILYKGPGGSVVLPQSVFLDRADGGHLIIRPPRAVWEQSELNAIELMHWCFLVGAIGRAMIDVLPQLEGGCVNYFEAGNWALNDAAPPKGRKTAREHRRVHMHVFGRSPQAKHPAWRWGEAPELPDYAERKKWTARFAPLEARECAAILKRARILLKARYA